MGSLGGAVVVSARGEYCTRVFRCLVGGLLSCAGALSGCGGGGGSSPSPAPPPPPSLSISPTAASLDVGMSKTFVASGGTPPYTFSTRFGDGNGHFVGYLFDAQRGRYGRRARDGFGRTARRCERHDRLGRGFRAGCDYRGRRPRHSPSRGPEGKALHLFGGVGCGHGECFDRALYSSCNRRIDGDPGHRCQRRYLPDQHQ